MICYPLAEHAEKCPITDIIFIDEKTDAPDGYSQGKIFVNGFAVSFSKTAKDRLPIQSVRLDIKPCSISTSKEGAKVPLHKLEREKDNFCEVSKLN
jgi:hypothetical protein